MRITCPSCASHFELPSELLGKKGRALKCATCQHAWYQAAQVESLDLASVMGQDYAAQAQESKQQAATAQQRAAQGGIQRVPPVPPGAQQAGANRAQAGAMGITDRNPKVQAGALGAPREPGKVVQAGQFRQPQATDVGPPPVPPGAVSMMRRNQAGQQAGQRGQPQGPGTPQQGPPSTAQSWFAGTARAPAAAPQPGAAGAPGGPPQAAAMAGQSMRGQAGAAPAPGQGAVSWMQSAAPGQPGAPGGAPGGAAGPGGPPQAAALAGQSMRGQAGAAVAPGQGAVSWMQNAAPGQPGALPGAPPGALGGASGAPGAPGHAHAQAQVVTAALAPPTSPAAAQAAALAGQSMRGQAGAAPAPGQGAVSWMQNAPQGQPGAPRAAGAALQGGAEGGPGAAPAPGQSMQSMRQPGAPAGPGEAAVSWMKPGAAGARQPGQSMINQAGPAGPGAPAVSQLSNEIVAPGQGARSLLDGSVAKPGAPGQSMLDAGGSSGGPGAPPPAAGPVGAAAAVAAGSGASGGPGAPASAAPSASAMQPGTEASAAGASGGPGSGSAAAAKAEAELVPGASGGPKAPADLKTDSKAEKTDPGVSGGPAAGKPNASDEEDELVDPDADRPNFGSADDERDADGTQIEEASDETAEEDDAFARVAARAGGKKAQTRVKPRRRIDPAYVTAAMMSGIVLSILVVLWAGRAQIAAMLPGFRAMYDRMGVAAPVVGEGLSIAESSKRLQRISGVETLVVRGYISNIGEIPRTVPGLRLELYNEKQEVIQDQSAPAPTALLDPGGSAEFEIRLELPQLSQARGGYAVVWAE